MEIRLFAEQVLLSESLDDKLKQIKLPITDDNPGQATRITEPARPNRLKFAARKESPAMPKPAGFANPARLAVAHHIMANHELQALEVMAFVLLAFPDAPAEFRRGMIDIMHDEQLHTHIHIVEAKRLGLQFGDLPVNCYIWKKAQVFECLLDYIACLPLVFEGRNLDHSLEFEEYFEAVDATPSAKIMRRIHNDEIRHVAFGWEWLNRLNPEGSSVWETWNAHLKWPIRPQKAVGDSFNVQARLDAGMSAEFIAQLEAALSSEENQNIDENKI